MKKNMVLTKEQRKALFTIYKRWWTPFTESYLSFRRRVEKSYIMDCIMVQVGKLNPVWLGVEKDGSTHS